MAVRPSGPPRAVRETARATSPDGRGRAGFPVALAVAVAVGIALVLVAGTGTAAAGTAAVGTAAVGTAAVGTAAVGTAAVGTAAVGTAAVGTAAVGTAAVGTAAVGTAAVGTAAVGTAAAGPLAARSAGVVPPAVPGSSVFVLGVPGLRWDDLSATRTPQLWKLATEGAIAALIVRGADEATPPADGWGTLSAGNRVRVPEGLAEVPPPPGPAVTPGRYPGMDMLSAAQGPRHTGAEPGALGEAVRSGARCTTAAGGAGALLAASDASGRVDGYGADVGEHACPLTVAEPDAAPDASPAQRLTAADVLAGRLADLRHDDDTLLVVAVGDPPATGAHLSVAIAVGPAFPAGTELTSASTGRVPFVQLVDVAPTALALLGIDAPKSMIGQPWGATTGVADLESRQALYEDLDAAARQAHRAVPLVVSAVVAAVVTLLGAAGALMAFGARTGRPGPGLRGRRLARLTSYGTAALPAATFLANLVPWWRGPLPLVLVVLAVADLLVLGIALAGPWRRDNPMGPFTAVALVTLAVLVADVVTGAHLQLAGVAGYNPLVAGRFSGIGNPAFGVLAVSALLTATLLAVRLPRPVLTVAAIGAVAILTDGAPRFGADVGGVIALVPAFGLLALAAAGRRPTWRGALVIVGVTVAALALFAAIDLARPPGSRTHLGRFASDLLGGSADETLCRKWDANLALLTRNAATLVVVPLAAGFTVSIGAGGPVARNRGARAGAAPAAVAARRSLGLCRGSGLGIGRQRQRCSRPGGDHVAGGARRGPGGDGPGSCVAGRSAGRLRSVRAGMAAPGPSESGMAAPGPSEPGMAAPGPSEPGPSEPRMAAPRLWPDRKPRSPPA